MFVLASKDAWDEYHAKRHEITLLRRAGTHPAEISYLQAELRRFVLSIIPANRGGPWLIPIIP